jgi:hypothetical protein
MFSSEINGDERAESSLKVGDEEAQPIEPSGAVLG